MPLIAVLGLLVVVAAVVALLEEGRDKTISTLSVVALVLGGLFLLWSYVDLVQQLLHGKHDIWFRIAAIATAVVTITMAVRVKNRVMGSLAAFAGTMLAAISLALIV